MADTQPTVDSARTNQLGWSMAAAGVACFCWVRSSTVNHQLLGSLIVLAALWPMVRFHTSSYARREGDYLQSYARGLPLLALLAGLGTAAWYLLSMRSTVGDVDMFYFLCYARDMNLGHEVADNAYSYFPGVYRFWRTALAISGASLSAIQTWHVMLLMVNCLLVAAIVWRLTHRWVLTLFAPCWAALLYSRFQGLHGTSEPLATIPLLLGLLAWNGTALQGRQAWGRCLLLGACFGLMVYSKQQAGLLSLGAIGLLLERNSTGDGRRHDLKMLATLPVVAIATLLLAILFEGRGLLPLTAGLKTLAGYGQEGSWWHNIYLQIRRDETAALALLASLLVTTCWLLKIRKQDDTERRQLAVALLLAIACLASLYQLGSRGFHHYMLLGIPGLTILATLVWQRAWQWRASEFKKHRPLCLVLLLLPLVPFLLPSDVNESFLAGRLPRPVTRSIPVRWHQHPALLDDLQQVRQQLPPGNLVLLVPARHNSLHFILGTRPAAAEGYNFQLSTYRDRSWLGEIEQRHDYVLIQSDDPDGLDSSDRTIWGRVKRRTAHRRLLELQYQQLVAGRFVSLYKRRQ